jgi:uncharacterized protein (TIGR03546 family)
MTPLKLIRSIGKLVRGGAGPSQIFIGCLLGVLIGMNPGVNLLLVLGVVLYLVLNAHLAVTLLGFALGKMLCVLLAPLTVRIGEFLIHQMGLEGLFAWLVSTPVLALMDLEVYCLIGGLLPALVVGALLGWAMVKTVMGIRKGLVAAQERSEKAQKVSGNVLVRGLVRVLFGKKKTSLAESLEARPPLFRKGGLILVAVVVVLLLVAEFVLAGYYFRGAVQKGLEQANGAEVNIESAHLSLLGGSMELQGVQVTDRDNPTQNVLQAGSIAGDLSVSDLLARRVVIHKLIAEDVRTGVKRQTPGRVLPREAEQTPDAEVEEAPQATEDAGESAGSVERYFKDAGKYRDKLRQVKEFLKSRTKTTAGDAQAEAPIDQPLLRRSASELLARHPKWVIRALEIRGITPREESTSYDVVGEEISDQPELNERPMSIRLTGKDGLDAIITFDFASPEGMHHIRLFVPAIDLGDAFPVSVGNGSVPLEMEGEFSESRVNIPFTIPIEAGQASSQGGKGLFFLNAATTQQLLGAVSEWSIYGTIEGSLDSPRVRFDEKRTIDGLKKAAEAGVLHKAEETIEDLEKKVGVEVPDELKSEGLEGLNGLFRKRK